MFAFIVGYALSAGSTFALDRYVEPAGGCGGNAPCYTTIGAAVVVSSTGDIIYVYPGSYAESVNLSSMLTPGNINLITVDSTGTLSPGTATLSPAAGSAIFNSVAPFPGNVTIDGFVVSSPNLSGISLSGTGGVEIDNVVANQCNWDGIEVSNPSGNVTISQCTTNNNGAGGVFGNGISLINPDINVEFSQCTANENFNDGYSASNVKGNATANDCVANSNGTDPVHGGTGIRFTNVDGDLSLDQCIINDNKNDGFSASNIIGNATLSQCTASNSGTGPFGGSGVRFTNVDWNMTLSQCTANENFNDGYSASNVKGNATVNDCVANNNGMDPVHGGNGSRFTNVDGDLSLDQCTNNDNKNDGLGASNVNGNATLSQCTANNSGTGPFGGNGVRLTNLYGNLTISDCATMDNNTYGIGLINMGATGTHQLTGGIICGNLTAGIYLAGTVVTLSGEGNWWGDASGPTHPGNAGGSGDTIIDGTNGGSGTIHYSPWISTVTANATADPVTVGGSTEVSFQFSNGGGAVYLGEGPGNTQGTPPFTLTTDNGTLTDSDETGASVSEFINNPDGILTVTLTPDTAGMVRVTLDGPCNLNSSMTADVQAVPNSLELYVRPNERTGNLTFAAGDTLVLEYTVRPSTGGFDDGRPLSAFLAVQSDPGQVDQVIALPITGGPIYIFGQGVSGPTPLDPQNVVPTFSGFAFPPAPDPLTGTLSFTIPAGLNNNFAFLGTIVDAGTFNFLSGIEVSNGFGI
jgi:hypothetical protein